MRKTTVAAVALAGVTTGVLATVALGVYAYSQVARYLQVEQAKRNAAEVAARRADAERAQARQAQSAAFSPDDTGVVDVGTSACEQSPSNLDLDALLRDKGTHYGVWGDAVVHAENINQ